MMIIILHYMKTEQNTLTEIVKEPIKKKLMCKTSVLWYAEQSSRANHALRLSWLMFTQLNVHQRKCRSTQSLMTKAVGHLLDQNSSICLIYILILWHTLCSGIVTLAWRSASNFTIETVMEGELMQMHSMIECDDIPNCRNEIPTPDVALAHPHLSDLASQLPDLKEDAEILLLIGRDHRGSSLHGSCR